MKSESPARPSSSARSPLLSGALLLACLALAGCEMLGVKKSADEPAVTPVAGAPGVTAPAGSADLPLAATSPSSMVPVPANPPAVETTTPTAPPAPPAARDEQVAAIGLSMEVGVYRCELNRSLGIKQIAADGQSLVMQWAGRDYPLTAVRARSGALRYEDPASGLTWITIVGKSLLLDLKNGQQLANECKHMPGVALDATPTPTAQQVRTIARPSSPPRKKAAQ
ncbi:MAG: MliC family protein [Burkholderiaceae bacterium]